MKDRAIGESLLWVSLLRIKKAKEVDDFNTLESPAQIKMKEKLGSIKLSRLCL